MTCLKKSLRREAGAPELEPGLSGLKVLSLQQALLSPPRAPGAGKRCPSGFTSPFLASSYSLSSTHQPPQFLECITLRQGPREDPAHNRCSATLLTESWGPWEGPPRWRGPGHPPFLLAAYSLQPPRHSTPNSPLPALYRAKGPVPRHPQLPTPHCPVPLSVVPADPQLCCDC